MKISAMRTLIFGLIICIGFTSCKDLTGIPDSFDYGKVDGNVYTNSYFDFAFTMPEGWDVMDNTVMDSLREQTQAEIEQADPELAKTIKAADVRTANLITVLYSADTSYWAFSPNLNFIAENVKIALHVKNGEDYLEAAKENLGKLEFSIEFKGDIYPIKIDGVEFHAFNIINHYSGMDIKQSYYAAIMHDFAFTFVASWVTDTQRAIIDQAISGMKFNIEE
jgi:hypothetical protein